MIKEKLYKIDENDNIRVWWMEIDSASHTTHSGIEGGKIVVSKPKVTTAKNIGKANEISAEEQAVLEVERKYVEQQKTGGYYPTVELAREGFKTYFQPMLADKWQDRKAKVIYPLWSQPKLDGCRAISTIGELKSREGENFVTPVAIMEIMKKIHEKYPSIVYDGELYNHELRDNFQKIVSLIRKQKPSEEHIKEANEKIQYHIYDLFDRNNPSMLWEDRTAKLKAIVEEINDPRIVFVKTDRVEVEESLDALYADYLEDSYEGQMVRINEQYEMKRSKFLLKRKEFEDAEFEVVDVAEGTGNWAGALKRVQIKLEDGSTQWATASGPFDILAQYLTRASEIVGSQVTVRFQGRTNDGKLRFPVVKVFWFGKRNNI